MKKILFLSAICASMSFAVCPGMNNGSMMNGAAMMADASNATAPAETTNTAAIDTTKGAELYKKCVACHGAKAEKSYMNKIPALNSIAPEERLKAMNEYKAGSLNKYKMGMVMKSQMSNLSEDDIKSLNDYISTLK